MTDLPIASNPQLPASAGAAPANGVPDAQPAEPFMALLARQMDEASSRVAPLPPTVTGAETPAPPAVPSGKDARDEPAAGSALAGSPACVLLAMLQLPREAGATAGKDTATGAAARIHPSVSAGAEGFRPAVNIDGQPWSNTGISGPGNQAALDMTAPEAARLVAPDNNPPNIFQPGVAPLAAIPVSQNATPLLAAAVLQNMPAGLPPPGIQQAIQTPLGSSGWADEFSQKISWMSTQQSHVAELHLNPPDLGPLDVVLKISDNQATAHFASAHGTVRDAVENALPKLREILSDNGITLGNATVGDQPPRDRDMERFMGQGHGMTTQHDMPGETSGSLAAAPPIASVRRHNGMVDTFA